MATWATLLTETGNLLDDTGNDRWTAAELRGYLNDALIEFCALTEIYRPRPERPQSLEIRLTSGLADYELIDVQGPILRVEDSRGEAILPATEEFLDVMQPNWRQTPQGYPKRYIRDKLNYTWFSLWPVPSPEAVTNASPISVFCATLPPTIATGGSQDSEEPVIPVQYHQALPYGAAMRALQRNQESLSLKLAEMYQARFMEYAQRATEDRKRSFRG